MTDKSAVYIIAEAGVNHNGDPDLALQLLKKAQEAGADAIKFQTFQADLISTADAQLATYQEGRTAHQSQREMLKGLELSHDVFRNLKKEAAQAQLDFLSTPFDMPSLEFLTQDLDLKRIKISSGDLSNLALLYEAAKKGVQVIISTGMACLGDIELALASLAWGYAKRPPPNSSAEAMTILSAPGTNDVLHENVTILHCTSAYPAKYEDLDLRAMQTIKTACPCPVGYSDHSLGIEVPIATVALGATVIEKHLTLDKTMEGPDHSASADPEEFARMVHAIRNIEASLGSAHKFRRDVEQDVVEKASKRIVAAKDIHEGDIITMEDLVFMRSSKGRFASETWDVANSPAPKFYKKGEVL